MVWVSPGIFDTKGMVAPNSPIALAKPSTMPASTPGSDDGLAPEIAPRQQPRDRNSERRCHQRRNRGHPQRELDRRPLRWRDIEHAAQVVGLTRNLKPYLSKMALAAGER